MSKLFSKINVFVIVVFIFGVLPGVSLGISGIGITIKNLAENKTPTRPLAFASPPPATPLNISLSTPPFPPEPYSKIDKFILETRGQVKEYKIGTALFKIFPRIDTIPGYFEAYNNNGQKIYTSNQNEDFGYEITYLFSFDYENNKYIVISNYSSGAHCCLTGYIFMLDAENNLKLIEKLDIGNEMYAITEDALLFKDEKPYLAVTDDRFAYFEGPYAGSYFFKKYYLIEGDKLTQKNSAFKKEYINEAERCKKEVSADALFVDPENYPSIFPSYYPVCITANYILAGNEETAWQKLHEVYTSYPFLATVQNEEGLKKAIQQEMKEYIKPER